jgi:hypothetical protein
MPIGPPIQQVPVNQGNNVLGLPGFGGDGRLDEQRLLSHEAVVSMIMKFIEPPLKMIVDLLNRGNMGRQGRN